MDKAPFRRTPADRLLAHLGSGDLDDDAVTPCSVMTNVHRDVIRLRVLTDLPPRSCSQGSALLAGWLCQRVRQSVLLSARTLTCSPVSLSMWCSRSAPRARLGRFDNSIHGRSATALREWCN